MKYLFNDIITLRFWYTLLGNNLMEGMLIIRHIKPTMPIATIWTHRKASQSSPTCLLGLNMKLLFKPKLLAHSPLVTKLVPKVTNRKVDV